MSCEKPVNSTLYLDTSTCNYNDKSSSISDSKRYRYVNVGETYASQVEDSCQVEKMFQTSWPTNNDDQNISCTDVHNELAYGFDLSWLQSSCFLNGTNHIQCIRDFTEDWFYGYIEQSQHWWNALVKNGPDSEEFPGIEVFSLVEAIHELTRALIPY
ncbi:hypothetical protein CFP56_002231 [Quercus suber]|uniref:Uncharacterized protein n=1 Tax=Quercus suber TaxID=58331 RepID=A0AAW0LEM6_QUESU